MKRNVRNALLGVGTLWGAIAGMIAMAGKYSPLAPFMIFLVLWVSFLAFAAFGGFDD